MEKYSPTNVIRQKKHSSNDEAKTWAIRAITIGSALVNLLSHFLPFPNFVDIASAIALEIMIGIILFCIIKNHPMPKFLELLSPILVLIFIPLMYLFFHNILPNPNFNATPTGIPTITPTIEVKDTFTPTTLPTKTSETQSMTPTIIPKVYEFNDGCITSSHWQSSLGNNPGKCLSFISISAKKGVGLAINYVKTLGLSQEKTIQPNELTLSRDYEGISTIIYPNEEISFIVKDIKATNPEKKSANFFIGLTQTENFSNDQIKNKLGYLIIYKFTSDGQKRICYNYNLIDGCQEIKNSGSEVLSYSSPHEIKIVDDINTSSLEICDGNGDNCIIVLDNLSISKGNTYLWIGYYIPDPIDFSVDLTNFYIPWENIIIN